MRHAIIRGCLMGVGVLCTPLALASWQTTYVELSQGSRYKIRNDFRRILTAFHSSSWAYGENQFSFSVVNGDSAGHFIYGDVTAGLSLNKVSEQGIRFGPLADVLVTGQAVWNESQQREYSYGLTTYFEAMRPVRFALARFYLRKDPELSQHTYAVQFSTQVTINKNVFFAGFVDWVPHRQASKHESIKATADLLLDAGRYFYKPYLFYAGVGYSFWDHKLGIANLREKVITLKIRAYL